MPRARTLEEYQFADLRRWIKKNSKMPERDDLIFLLSFRAGLRAVEISRLNISSLLDVSGKRPANFLRIETHVGKMGRPREIPMHPELCDAVVRFRNRYPNAECVAIGAYKGNARMSPNTVAVHMWKVLQAAGFKGASSHSGRRTFGTKLARRANQFHNSLKDVQNLLGHARLDTTENYLEPSEDTNAMVNSL